jgi:plastocyanin
MSKSSGAIVNGVLIIGAYDEQLYAFDAMNGTKLWTSGYWTMRITGPQSPAVSGGMVFMTGHDGHLYAFGDTPGDPSGAQVQVTDSEFKPATITGHKLGYGVTWQNVGSRNHAVTSSGSLKVFDSGTLVPGDTFTYQVFSAGQYRYLDSLNTSHTGVVKAPVQVSATSGSMTTQFTITWASKTAPAGYVYDVQIKRPGQAAFGNWKVDQTGSASTFVPDGGSGVYQLRGRLEQVSTGATTGWSGPTSITVS